MRGDFSRIRFERAKQYTAVLEQQGRVALDADANEQRAIDAYLRETETVDVVGRYGAPVHDAGFGITVQNNGILIGAGRYYVNGLLCENPAAATYEGQPFLLNATKSTALIAQLIAAGRAATIRVSLQAWQRLVTALDDPCLREPALGQADTTARLQTVYRVVAALVAPSSAVTSSGSVGANAAAGSIVAPERISALTPCCQAMYAVGSVAHTGSMSAQISGATDTCGCQPIPAAGYRGLENQLYRVEIHQGGNASTATFKWSRENGSVVVAITAISGADVTVASLGPDANLGFQSGQWVEISDDTSIFGDPPNQPGRLYQIKQVYPASLTITMTTSVLPVDLSRNPRLRRWDQTGPAATATGIPLSASWIDLENGIQVRFGPGDYSPGDYWTISARAASGQIEWPPCGSDGQPFQGPHYAEVHTAPLACIHYNPDSLQRFTIDECRLLFSPLVELAPPALPSALHVTKINWANDDVMTLDVLVKNGLAVTFDQAPDGPVTSASFIVTLETPIVSRFSTGAFAQPAGAPAAPLAASAPTPAPTAAAGGPPPAAAPASAAEAIIIIDRFTYTVWRSPSLLDYFSTIVPNGNTLTWIMPFGGLSSNLQNLEVLEIDAALLAGMSQGWPGRLRVKLLGNAIFAGTGASRVFLDGQAFGQPALRADGTTSRVDLQLPSGDGQKASDFESWFYLYPTLQVASVQVTYTALTVRAAGAAVVVTASTPATTPLPTAQQATINLNYPALVATPINLSLQGPGGIVTAPSSITIGAGAISIAVTLPLIGVPAAGAVATFTLTASITNALGFAPAVSSQSFTISPAPPIIP
jgi:hypothetical protein